MALDKQMDMFEDGGLMQEGGTVDPVSGNDVPVGSTQEEVRDDIPAQLSEGEFVFPADVVRYFGLETLMKMRDEAKAGLARMEAMGQMGNADEATLPDDVPFSVDDLDIEDDGVVEYNQGGVVQPQGFTGIGGYQQSQFANYVPQQPTMPQQQVQQAPAYTPPQQAAVPTQAPSGTIPDYTQFMQGAKPAKTITIINPTTKEERTITFIEGVTQIPEGFILKSEYKEPEVVGTTGTGTTQVTGDGGSQDDDSQGGPSGAIASLGGTLNPDGTVSGSTQFNMSYDIPGTLPGILGTALGVAQISTSGLPEGGLAKISKPTNPDLVLALTPKYANGTVVGKGKSVTSEQSKEIADLYQKLEDNDISGQYGVESAQALSDAIDEGMLGSETGLGSGPTGRGYGGTGRGRSDVDVTPSATAAANQAQQQQQDDNDDNNNSGGGTSVYGGGGSGGFGVGTFGSGNTGGFNKGGSVTKPMKQSGLAAKK